MPTCAVVGCLSGSGRGSKSYPQLSFPECEECRQKWLKIVNRGLQSKRKKIVVPYQFHSTFFLSHQTIFHCHNNLPKLCFNGYCPFENPKLKDFRKSNILMVRRTPSSSLILIYKNCALYLSVVIYNSTYRTGLKKLM